MTRHEELPRKDGYKGMETNNCMSKLLLHAMKISCKAGEIRV